MLAHFPRQGLAGIAAAALASSQATLRQVQKLEAIGQLTGGVAHDFNNLLQVISGNLQLLMREIAGNEKAERRISNAMEAVTGGARLASQLLAFARRQPLAPKVVNLGRLVRSMDEILRRALGEAIEVETVVAGGLWNTLVDPGNVENALLNLAINARDAMEGQGSLTIEVGNACLDDTYAQTTFDVTPGQYVMLSVTDTGTGIPPLILERQGLARAIDGPDHMIVEIRHLGPALAHLGPQKPGMARPGKVGIAVVVDHGADFTEQRDHRQRRAHHHGDDGLDLHRPVRKRAEAGGRPVEGPHQGRHLAAA
ncbi:histidine kinase dimerization/phospho-acceptor domain-containing protein [Paracoccaceae bacterium Fryx2]|nr:histidine kinase dimerization/phospho-acceptor domain-containing protein [Paracoccaceae bacterium Fryx2]